MSECVHGRIVTIVTLGGSDIRWCTECGALDINDGEGWIAPRLERCQHYSHCTGEPKPSPVGCKLCGAPLAYVGAVFCGAGCCARWEGGNRSTRRTDDGTYPNVEEEKAKVAERASVTKGGLREGEMVCVERIPGTTETTYEITYFKTHNGKYYTTDSMVWPTDAPDHSGYNPLSSFHRIKTMHAVCMRAPHGFPQFSPAQESETPEPALRIRGCVHHPPHPSFDACGPENDAWMYPGSNIPVPDDPLGELMTKLIEMQKHHALVASEARLISNDPKEPIGLRLEHVTKGQRDQLFADKLTVLLRPFRKVQA